MRTLPVLVLVVAACGGDDGVHHLADAPVPPSARGIYVTQATNSVVVFALDATGNAAPLRTLTGALTGMNLPIGVDFDATSKTVFVANRQGGNVLVFDAEANGNVAPVRMLTTGGVCSAEGLALTPTGELHVSCCPGCGSGVGGQAGVFHFAKDAATSDSVLGGATNANTKFTNPGSLAFDADTSELYVGNSFGGDISVYPPGSQGDVSPMRAFSPGSINLQSLAFANNTVYVTVPSSATGVVLGFDAASTGTATPATMFGNVAPLSVSYPGGIYVDGGASPPVVYLVDYLGNAIHIIHTTGTPPNLAVGTVETITGAATGLNMPLGIHVVK